MNRKHKPDCVLKLNDDTGVILFDVCVKKTGFVLNSFDVESDALKWAHKNGFPIDGDDHYHDRQHYTPR